MYNLTFNCSAPRELLLKGGTDIAAKKTSGETALHKAAMSGHEAVVRLLLEKGLTSPQR